MSSTNRSDARKSHVADYYLTPVKDIELFLKSFSDVEDVDFNNISILDPCAGGDAANPMSYPTALNNVFGGNGGGNSCKYS